MEGRQDPRDLPASFWEGREGLGAAYLFGSSATGRRGPEPDIDIALLLEEAILTEGHTRSSEARVWQDRLIDALGTDRIDLVVLNGAPLPLAHRVLRDGILLHSRDENHRIAHSVSVIRRWADQAWLRELFRTRLKTRLTSLGPAPTMVDKAVLERKLRLLERYVEILRNLGQVTLDQYLEEPRNYGSVERFLQLSAESVIDIGAHIVADEALGAPETYREIFQLLEQSGNVPATLAGRMKSWARFRNVLVHLYEGLDQESCWSASRDGLEDLEAFLAWASRFL